MFISWGRGGNAENTLETIGSPEAFVYGNPRLEKFSSRHYNCTRAHYDDVVIVPYVESAGQGNRDDAVHELRAS